MSLIILFIKLKIQVYSQAIELVKQANTHFMILLITHEARHKSWVLILLGSKIKHYHCIEFHCVLQVEPQDVGLYGHKLELFDICQ